VRKIDYDLYMRIFYSFSFLATLSTLPVDHALASECPENLIYNGNIAKFKQPYGLNVDAAKKGGELLKLALKAAESDDPFFSPEMVSAAVSGLNDRNLVDDLAIFYSQGPFPDGPFNPTYSQPIRGTWVYHQTLLVRIKQGTGKRYEQEQFGSGVQRCFFNMNGTKVEESKAQIVSFGDFLQ
jgi:hypothetical protein